LWTAFNISDVYPEGHPQAGYIWDIYSSCSFTTSSGHNNTGKECEGGFNREHSLPKSWWGNSGNAYESIPAGCDLGHLYPTDAYVNGIRNAYAFGEVKNAKYTFSISKQGTSGTSLSIDRSTISGTSTTFSSTTVFEPADEYKGDLARTYMYMRARYSDMNLGQASGGILHFTTTTNAASDSQYGWTDYSVILLMKWHRQDPVSQKEIDRNNAMERLQGNRNPFIDYPILAEYLWGEKNGQTFYLTDAIGSFDNRFIPGVSDGSAGSYTPCTPEQPTAYFAESSLFLNIAETVPVNLFTTSSDGAVTYTSSNTDVAEVDANTGTLTLVGAGTATITASVAATECYKTATAQYSVTVYDFRSLPATEVRSNSFTANWTEDKAGKYTLDVTNESSSSSIENRDTTWLNETFASGQGDFRIVNIDLGDLTWVWTYVSTNGGYMKGSAFKSNTNYAAESWLLGPELDLQDATEAAVTFEGAAKYQNGTLRDEITLWIAEEPDYDFNAEEWTQLTIPKYPVAGSWTYVSTGAIDISAYKDKKVRLAIRYLSTSDGADTYYMKNFRVTGKYNSIRTASMKEHVDGYPKQVTGTSAEVTGLQPSTTYTYTVTPLYGTASDEVEVTTADCSATITIKSSNEALGTVEFVP
jgi:endonuclease I